VDLEQLNSLVEDKDMLSENLEILVQKERRAGEQLGIEKGRQEAEKRALESKRDTVRHLLAFGVLTDEQIAQATGLSVDDIAKLRLEDKH
tara:strand:+ start:2310 stop:2579 length:270 start_codon:yes stop_codon:yes gene_type:complete